MKKNILLFWLMGLGVASAQNLVPNHDFETYTSCPVGVSQYDLATGWQVPPGSITTPDYYNTCNTGTCSTGVPDNWVGNSSAYSGNAYMGIITYYAPPSGAPDLREYLQVQLTSPLTAGEEYHLNFYAKNAPDAPHTVAEIGAYFSVGTVAQPGNQPIAVTPQVQGAMPTTSVWTLISGTYVASGGENYLTIGNFLNDAASTITYVGSTPACQNLFTTSTGPDQGGAGYCYIDNFEVISTTTSSLDVTTSSTSILCQGDCTADATASPAAGVPPYSFSWTSGQTTQTITGLCAGTYSVTVTDAADSSATSSVTITDGFNIPLSITQDGDTLSATTAPNYQWYLNDTLIPGAISQHYVITGSGYYYVVTSGSGCTFASNTIETSCLCVGINENDFSGKISIYPNPASNTISVLALDNNQFTSVTIYTIQGEIILTSTFDIQHSVFDISPFASGTYYLTLQSDEGVAVKRFEVIR